MTIGTDALKTYSFYVQENYKEWYLSLMDTQLENNSVGITKRQNMKFFNQLP